VFSIGLVTLKKALVRTLQRAAPQGSVGDRTVLGALGVLAVVATVAAVTVSPDVQARTREARSEAATVATVDLAALPSQAQMTFHLIESGGPFPYPKDGMVFGNRERLLPTQSRGYYREYTVKTPGSRDRGARRIICGGTPPERPEACFYTEDHYASFRRIVQ
jgi:ribonuclease T1